MASRDEVIKERIRYYTDWARSLWIGVLALTGGLGGLRLNLDSPAKGVLFLIGLVVDFLLLFGIILLHRRIERLMSELGKEKPWQDMS